MESLQGATIVVVMLVWFSKVLLALGLREGNRRRDRVKRLFD